MAGAQGRLGFAACVPAQHGRRSIDGVLGGAVGAEIVNVVSSLIDKHGGVQGLVSQFEKQGLGGVVQSWVRTGANQSITAEQIRQALGSNAVAEMAAKFGLNPQDLAQKLAQALPQTVDKLTPAGVVPKS
jgi:uncharacterized protein YidB (DUF937 family)